MHIEEKEDEEYSLLNNHEPHNERTQIPSETMINYKKKKKFFNLLQFLLVKFFVFIYYYFYYLQINKNDGKILANGKILTKKFLTPPRSLTSNRENEKNKIK